MTSLRVRQILSSLGTAERAELKTFLPAGMATAPAGLKSISYPSAVLKCFPQEGAYACLGLLAEELLRRPAAEITLPVLLQSLLHYLKTLPMQQIKSIRTSVTTAPFLEALQATRTALESTVGSEILYDQVLSFGAVVGHPDACTAKAMVEIKLSGLPEKNWMDFVLQLAAYGALSTAEELVLVLPLQKTVARWDIRGWAGRAAYRDALQRGAQKVLSVPVADMLVAALLRETWAIGSHVRKLKTLADTVRSLPDPRCPYQIFLGNPQSSTVSVKDADIAAAAQMVAATGAKLYVHTPYIINLCASAEGDWNTQLLVKNVQIARAAGCRGVVVHVGKSVKQPLAAALSTMRTALQKAMEHASPECPVLLETPAGQGTETLTKQEEFIGFVEEFADPRLRICLDTCHVFACGHTPLKYLGAMDEKRDLVKLIHYNDSAADCGSCVDRHAYIGTGKIGLEGMQSIAEYCGARGWPMLIE